jgi:acetoin utilization protein AcuB
MRSHAESIVVPACGVELYGGLSMPTDVVGVVLFAHGSGSSRFSHRNWRLAGTRHEAVRTGSAGVDVRRLKAEDIMRVQDVMTESVQTVRPGTSAEAAWSQMRQAGIHHLVVTRGAQIAGVLSDRDVGGRQGASVRRGRTVGELMTPQVVTVPPDTPIRKAANLMRGRSIGCLVVAERNRLAGIVTVADLLTLIGRGVTHPVESSRRWTLKHRTPHAKQHRAGGAW